MLLNFNKMQVIQWSYFFNSNTDNLIEEHPDIFDFLNDSETTN